MSIDISIYAVLISWTWFSLFLSHDCVLRECNVIDAKIIVPYFYEMIVWTKIEFFLSSFRLHWRYQLQLFSTCK